MVEQALERFGRLDAVFANAGRGGSPGGFSGADHEAWREMILTNVYGVGLTLQATLPALRRSRGQVLLTGSAAGRATIPGSMYSATKWAVTGIGYNLREELRGSGIRVTLLEPGMVDTPFFDEPPEYALEDRDIANAVIYALGQPAHVDVNEILIRPTPPWTWSSPPFPPPRISPHRASFSRLTCATGGRSAHAAPRIERHACRAQHTRVDRDPVRMATASLHDT